MMTRYIPLLLFVMSHTFAFSQKVLIIKKPLMLNPADKMYVMLKNDYDTCISYQHNAQGDFVIPVQGDQIYLCGVDEYLLHLEASNPKLLYKPPVYLLKNLSKYKADTIAISGLEFREYFYKQDVTGLSGERVYSSRDTTRLIPDRPGYKGPPFPNGIARPVLSFNNTPMKKPLMLGVHTGAEETYTIENGKTSVYKYDTLYFEFEIDMEKPDQ